MVRSYNLACSQSTGSRVISRVTEAIVAVLSPEMIRFPSDATAVLEVKVCRQRSGACDTASMIDVSQGVAK